MKQKTTKMPQGEIYIALALFTRGLVIDPFFHFMISAHGRILYYLGMK